MNRNVALAMTLHDTEGRLGYQLSRMLPVLTEIFGGLAVRVTRDTDSGLLDRLASAGVKIDLEAPATGDSRIGQARRVAVDLALQFSKPFVMYCDCDRVLHWAEYHRAELARIAEEIVQHDFTVLGRTSRAYGTHPRVQRDTEAIINHVFALCSGTRWDVSAAARGLSRRAADSVVRGCPDDNISTDVSWTLFLQWAGGFSMGYIETEGLEFETADRYGDEIAKAGGLAAWIAQLDADPQQWAQRLDLARVEVEAMRPYARLKPL